MLTGCLDYHEKSSTALQPCGPLLRRSCSDGSADAFPCNQPLQLHRKFGVLPVCRDVHAKPQKAFLKTRFRQLRDSLNRMGLQQAPPSARQCVPQWELRVTIKTTLSALEVQVAYGINALKDRARADGTVATLLEALEMSDSFALAHHISLLRPPCLHIFVSLSDFVMGNIASWPLLGLVTSAHASNFPVPDWTFAQTPHPNSIQPNSSMISWAEASKSLLNHARQTPPRSRNPTLTWRGSPANQPFFSRALPFEQRHRRTLALRVVKRLNRSGQMARIGLSTDVRSSLHSRLSWLQMCAARYQLHLAGFSSYAVALKQRLACGSVVLRPKAIDPIGPHLEPSLEWWQAVSPLSTNVELVDIDANLTELAATLASLEREPERAARISTAASDYVDRVLSPDAVSCYWHQLLMGLVPLVIDWRQRCAPHEEHILSARVEYLANPARVDVLGCFPRRQDPCFRLCASCGYPSDPKEGKGMGPDNITNATGFVHPLIYQLGLDPKSNPRRARPRI